MIIQVCFQVKDKEHNQEVIEKLKVLKSTLCENDKVISCHLPLHIVQEKNFDDSMVIALHEIFAGQYECMVKADDFNTAMKYMNYYRENASMQAHRIFIIGQQDVGNIALELELFSKGKIKFL